MKSIASYDGAKYGYLSAQNSVVAANMFVNVV